MFGSFLTRVSSQSFGPSVSYSSQLEPKSSSIFMTRFKYVCYSGFRRAHELQTSVELLDNLESFLSMF
jgi:hypothetical protein